MVQRLFVTNWLELKNSMWKTENSICWTQTILLRGTKAAQLVPHAALKPMSYSNSTALWV